MNARPCSVFPCSRGLRARVGFILAASAAVAIVASAAPRSADAACNVIPTAKRLPPYRSSLGSVDDPIASPPVAGVPAWASEVVLRIDPNCDTPPIGVPLGFVETPITANEITLEFGPSASIDATPTEVSDCDLTASRCRTLKFVMPDTTPSRPGAPEGLAGVAKILVRDTAGNELARIDALYEYKCGGTESRDKVFGAFVVLPRPNVLQPDLTSEILATEDGNGGLLVPLSFKDVRLPDTQGERATWLHGWSDFAAKDGATDSLRSLIASYDSRSDFVRAFTLNGRPLPPLVRLTAQGEMIGFTDSDASVVRIACREPDGPSSAPSLCRFTNRRAANGPVKLGKKVQLGKDVALEARPAFPFPLASIRSSEKTVALVREESDGSLMPQVAAVDIGEIHSTGRAAAASSVDALELEVAGRAVAFPEHVDRVFQLFDNNGVRRTAIGSWRVAERRLFGGRDTFAVSTRIAAFARDPEPGEPGEPLSVFRWDNPALVNNIDEVKLAALSHDRLVYVVPENESSTTLTTRLRDYATAYPNCVHDLKVSASRLVITSDVIVLTEGEPGVDEAGDVRVFALRKDEITCPPPAEVKLAVPLRADSIGAWGASVALGVVDGATPDTRILHVFDTPPAPPLPQPPPPPPPPPPTVTPVNLQHAVDDFVVGEHAVAFRASESKDGRDHNGDGDQNDSVMFFYKPDCLPCTPSVTACCDAGICKTGLAARPCTRAKCDPRSPYRIVRDALWFIANEIDQGADLDGIAGKTDVIASVPLKSCGFAEYDPQVQPIVALPMPPEGGMPPIDFAGGLVQLAALPDGGDGTAAAGIAVEGDSDEDGVFDFLDKCDTFRDRKQIDRDRDGIGDPCDTDVTLCDPVPRESCQQAGGHGSTLHVQPDGKAFTWTWRAADGVGADVPDPIVSHATYSLCVYGKTPANEPRLVRTNFFAGDRCGEPPCWTSTAGNGWRYDARRRSNFDVVAMAYHDPTFPQAELVVRTEAEAMVLAPLGAHFEPAALVGTVTLQLVADDGSGPVCLGSKSLRIQ